MIAALKKLFRPKRQRPFLLITSLCIYDDGSTEFDGELYFATGAERDDVVLRVTDAVGAALNDCDIALEQLILWERQLVDYAWQQSRQQKPQLRLVASP